VLDWFLTKTDERHCIINKITVHDVSVAIDTSADTISMNANPASLHVTLLKPLLLVLLLSNTLAAGDRILGDCKMRTREHGCGCHSKMAKRWKVRQ